MEKGKRVIVKNFLTIPIHIRGENGVVIGKDNDGIIVEIGEGQCTQTFTLPPRYLEEDNSRKRPVL